MQIVVTLDKMLAMRSITGKQLAERVGISETQMSLFRSGKVKGIRFATLEKICEELQCKPGDLLDISDEG
ncbi:helix-turn-helix domain-containing protein [Sphingomicrobium marinum]|uniref:helix-turn-helix domain-containing protein n=1 Tax=Sphingomicrobium marinum TaxID=1227950 RepID=UPI00223EE8B3|nr:helix-turn-helix transcriptional regulator [Sphingomicrobium marinum]